MRGEDQFVCTADVLSKQLALNLTTALRYAGQQRDDGAARPMRSVDVQRKTGIARSTLRALKNCAEDRAPNPDLHTLARLAQTIGIPLAFLLMRPQDWRTLMRAIDGLGDPLRAADRLVETNGLPNPGTAEKILKECGVHPERPPLGATVDKKESSRIEGRNEWRRQRTNVLAALAQQGTHDRKTLVPLTALAASIANQSTPTDPGIG